ncbi:MAG: electron transport complex subunit RsxC [Gammaproteobacteria bacterium]|nr:electron transport complex subunit RsxC [Gammaproteobacteria bacterium]MDH5803327.1 electron transport complex subunit RsxC [Gammaproteobacteria bacterium]
MIRRLFNFHGGVHLRQHKTATLAKPIKDAELPQQLVLPLQQHIGHAAEPVVKVGDYVYRNQLIARAVSGISAPVHAPSSGKVIALEPRPVPHPSGLQAPCIVIETDGKDQDQPQSIEPLKVEDLSPQQLRDQIHAAGIVGLGGAGFPSSIKLDPDEKVVDLLIINGAECEPYITCDEMLIREHTEEIVQGLMIMRKALQAQHCIIAVENKKAKALLYLEAVLEEMSLDFVELVSVPTVYPAGGEKQLVQVITGKEVPSQGLPLDINIVCHNVGTAYAVARAIHHNEPLTSRIITVTGSVAKSRNLRVRFGTPIAELIQQCGGNCKTLSKVIIGGPMMGMAVHDINAPVIKTSNCILAISLINDVPLPSRLDQSLPCIRCGFCAEACPMNLLPQQLYWYAKSKDFDKVQDYNLFDCIECGCCDYACPSHIPLVHYYRYAKTEIWKQEREQQKSDISRQRHEFRNLRLELEKQEKAARHKRKQQAISGNTTEDKKKAAIQAAMERVKAKREQSLVHAKNTENLSEEQQRLIAEVDKRRSNPASGKPKPPEQDT